MTKSKTLFTYLGLGLGICAVLAALYGAGLLRLNYPDRKNFPVQGLDVSHHQQDIEWSMMPLDRYQFVYIKATEGGDFKDKKFQDNWSKARKAGFQTGAYHFFTLCRPGKEQAMNFIETVPKEESALPPVIDLEFVGNCSQRPSKDDLVASLKAFVHDVSAFYNAKPILYTTYEFYTAYLQGTEFESYSYWIRDIYHRPNVKIIPNWVIWQYADNARVEGIGGKVDLNAVNPASWLGTRNPSK